MTEPTLFGGPELDMSQPAQLLTKTSQLVRAAQNALTPDLQELAAMKKTTDKRVHLRRRCVTAAVAVVIDTIVLAIAYDKYRKA